MSATLPQDSTGRGPGSGTAALHAIAIRWTAMGRAIQIAVGGYPNRPLPPVNSCALGFNSSVAALSKSQFNSIFEKSRGVDVR